MASLDIFFGYAANNRRKHLVRLAESAVAARAFPFPYLLAIRDCARSFRNSLEVRQTVDIPFGDFLVSRGTTDIGVFLRKCHRACGCKGNGDDGVKQPGHSKPPLIQPLSRTG